MSKKTLLQIVRSVLSAMDDDDVSYIGETPSAEQVLMVAREVYEELAYDGDWKHLCKIRELESVSDTTRPNFLKIPANVYDVQWIKYDVTTVDDSKRIIDNITRLENDEFLDLVYSRSTADDNVIVVETEALDGVPLFIIDDHKPTYWTSFDDEYIIFDSYDKDQGSTLQGSRSIASVREQVRWEDTNTFVPDFPENMFPTYLAKLKTKCFFYHKQTDNPLDRIAGDKGENRNRTKGEKTQVRYTKPNYGR